MMAAMKQTDSPPESLLEWCNARRGRTTKLAKYLQKSREFVRQMANEIRPVPHEMQVLIPAAMKKIEREEAKSMSAAMRHINQMARGQT